MVRSVCYWSRDLYFNSIVQYFSRLVPFFICCRRTTRMHLAVKSINKIMHVDTCTCCPSAACQIEIHRCATWKWCTKVSSRNKVFLYYWIHCCVNSFSCSISNLSEYTLSCTISNSRIYISWVRIFIKIYTFYFRLCGNYCYILTNFDHIHNYPLSKQHLYIHNLPIIKPN